MERMPEQRPDDVAAVLGDMVPTGVYLLEQRGIWRRLWRIVGDEPTEDTIAPASLMPELVA
jgi:hypothetical protein